MRWALALGAIAAAAAPPAAAEVADAIVTLEVTAPALPGSVPAAAPLRFALLDDGHVFVGGTSVLAEGRLEGSERKDLEKRIERVAKDKGLGGEVRLGPGDTRYRLHFGRRNLLVVAVGDPSGVGGSRQALAELIEGLARFDHVSLRPWAPRQLLLAAQRVRLPGGCRPWEFDLSLADVVRRPTAIPAAAATGWPTGAVAASVCSGGDRYAVTLRPLVPGES